MKFIKVFAIVVAALTLTQTAKADPEGRLSLGVGIITLGKPSQTGAEISAEYEHRYSKQLGYGGMISYVFVSSGVTMLGIPEGFLHPLGGDWILYGMPLIEMGSVT